MAHFSAQVALYICNIQWIKQNQETGSFKAKDNLTDEQKELIELRKRNKQLEMENDILKQAALIMGRR